MQERQKPIAVFVRAIWTFHVLEAHVDKVLLFQLAEQVANWILGFRANELQENRLTMIVNVILDSQIKQLLLILHVFFG